MTLNAHYELITKCLKLIRQNSLELLSKATTTQTEMFLKLFSASTSVGARSNLDSPKDSQMELHL